MEKEALWIRRENLTNEDEVFTTLKDKGYTEESYFSKDNWEVIMTATGFKLVYVLAKFDAAWSCGNVHHSWLTVRKEIKSQKEFINLL